jgi:tetratricopeptide (TPR) repeat protein
MPAPRLPSVLIAALLAGATLSGTPARACARHDTAAATPALATPTLGSVRFPTSTRVPAAQAAFERGMLWLHLFEYTHAAQEFRAAQALDPGLALAYWGEAMTYTHALWNQDEPEAARAALARLGATAQARAARAGSERERAFLDTAEQLFGEGTVAERDARFLAAAAALDAAYQDDAEARLLHALALLGATRGMRDEKNYLQAAALARDVLARQPDHPGAAHYWIHGMDDPAHAAGALEPASALARIAPDAGHAQHMTSHIFLALGRWEDVVAANVEANRVTDAELRAAGLPAFACGHYNEWLLYAYFQLGRGREAQALLDACARDGEAALAWMHAHPGRPFRALKGPEALQRRWHESLVAMRAAAVVDGAAMRARNAARVIDTGDIGRYAGWDAFARALGGDSPAGVPVEREALARLRKQAAEAGELQDLDAYLAILDDMLAADLAADAADYPAALAAAARASSAYDALPFAFGPPVPVKPPHELEGELLLRTGQPAAAVARFDRALALAPKRAGSLLGKARALVAVGRVEDARAVYAELAAIWAHADADWPDLAEVRAGAAAD